jgi:hypothetical protein
LIYILSFSINSSPHYYYPWILISTLRIRYWRLTIKDILEATYPQDKANHWDIKCLQGEYQHFGVFWFKYGTPFDKEPVHGISFYYNDVSQKTVESLIEFLQTRYGGKVFYRQGRVFLQGSKEFSDPKEIATLANDISVKYNGPVEITVEFEKVTQEEQEKNLFNLPASKALPIVGPD